jgi:hypothetical protein
MRNGTHLRSRFRRGPKPNMKLTKKITLALGLLATGVGYAQTTAATPATTSNAGYGLLGHRYTELSVGVADVKHYSQHGYSVGASANNPVIPGVLDAGAGYAYSWIRGGAKGHANTIGTYATAYAPLGGVKPFVSAALGYQWTSAKFGMGNDEAIWGGAIGVEIPVGAITITPRISYSDDFEGTPRSSQAWTTSVEANYWFKKDSAVFGSIGHTDARRSPVDSWNYEVGLRARF